MAAAEAFPAQQGMCRAVGFPRDSSPAGKMLLLEKQCGVWVQPLKPALQRARVQPVLLC